MTTPRASAPGKVMLAGEYAVIDGAEAVMMAVDRRAFATLAPDPVELSAFLAAARDAVAAARGDDAPATRAAARVVVDSRALASARGVKLGLGSSAAATVAAVGCALAAEGPFDRAAAHALAHRAHALAQVGLGAPGSGADIATAVHGGVLAVRRGAVSEPLLHRPLRLPAGLALVLVWTGEPASTGPLVARVRALRDQAPRRYERLADALAAAAAALAAAATADAAIAAIAAGGDAVRALGDAAGTALWTAAHDRIDDTAHRHGAAVKPTGAGGGDLALVAAPVGHAQNLRLAIERAGMETIDVNVDPDGLRLEPARVG